MKTQSLFFRMMTLTFLLALVSCSSKKEYSPGVEISNAFKSLYPHASAMHWQKKQDFAVVKFSDQHQTRTAWFESSGTWVLTTTEIKASNLPLGVAEAIAKEYGGWRIDESIYVEEPNSDPLYVIEIEKGSLDMALYYTPSGVLLKAVKDASSEYEPLSPNAQLQIKESIAKIHPGSRIDQIEKQKRYYQCEITQVDGIEAEVYLDLKFQWVESLIDLEWIAVPSAVQLALAKEKLTFDSDADDVYFVRRPLGVELYLIELDREPSDLIRYYTKEGFKAKAIR